jgi:hypothetical protein
MQKEKNHVPEIASGGLLNQALRHTPAIKYAIAVAAIAGLIATSLRYGFSAATLVFGVIIVIGLMVLFFAFTQLAEANKRATGSASVVVLWSFLLLCIASAVFLFSSAFFDWPLPLRSKILGISPDLSKDRQGDARKPTVDPGVTGEWEYTTQVMGHDLHLRFLFRPDGTFERREYFDERGKWEAKDGSWMKTVSGSGVVQKGSYTFADADTLTLDWLGLPTTYKRKTGTAAGDDPFVGTWKGSTFLLGLNWDAEMQIWNDKSTRSIMETKESGTIDFKDGKWSGMSSWTSGPVTGSYRNVTPDSFEITVAPFGWITLKRVTPLREER